MAWAQSPQGSNTRRAGLTIGAAGDLCEPLRHAIGHAASCPTRLAWFATTRIWAGMTVCPPLKSGTPGGALHCSRKHAGGGVMASSFLIVMSIWFGVNILFVAARLW